MLQEGVWFASFLSGSPPKKANRLRSAFFFICPPMRTTYGPLFRPASRLFVIGCRDTSPSYVSSLTEKLLQVCLPLGPDQGEERQKKDNGY